jgi:hypothetical protein
MKDDLLPALRKELESSFGRKVVSSRDCLQMVDDIYQKTGYTINANTLRRFFGLVKTSYSASPSTLTILSKYCGFNSLDELENISSSPRTDSSVNTEEVFQYLVSLFKNFPVGEIFNPVMTSIVQQTVSFLERNSSLIERFQREVAGTPAGQYYYFERSVNMDRLNGYYGEGLRYYLRAKNNNEARVFTYSLQVFRYWLSNDAELIEKNMAALASVSMTINYPSHILARYIAARLYYANYKADIPDKILADAAKYYAAINARSETPDPDFDLIVGEALILTNHVAEGSEYIRRGKSKLAGLPGSTGTENFFNTWEKILNSRKNTLSKVITSPLKSNRSSYIYTSPLNKRYFNLVRLSADSKAKKNNVPELLRETGFIRLSC